MKDGKHVNEYGSEAWYQDGKYHREDGPAIRYASGTEYWYLNNEQHRTDGPAVTCADGTELWFINGEELTKAEFNKLKPKKQEIKMLETVKKQALSLKSKIEPYERYIVVAALLIALDHFILKGALRGKITELGTALGNKFTNILNKAIEKLEV